MELDKLKNSWEKISEIDAKPCDEQILNLLKSSNKNIWHGIIKYEKIGFIIALIVSPLCYLPILIFEEEFLYLSFMTLFFMTVMAIWQLLKWMYLRKIDIINSDILSTSKYVNKYRDFCIYEWIVIAIWLIIFYIIFFMTPPSNFSINRYFLMGGLLLGIVPLAFIFARVRYEITIGKIKRNLKEIKAFETEE